MPRRNPLYELVDQNLDGELEALLGRWRADGLSFEGMAHQLRERGITVTGETVRNWSTRLGIHAPTGDAA